MTIPAEANMVEAEDVGAARFGRGARIAGWGAATAMLVLIGVGFVGAHVADGGSLSWAGGGVLATIVLLALLCGWRLVRVLRMPGTDDEPLTPRERLNRNILAGSGLIGGAMAMVILFGSPDGLEAGSAFSNTPLPPGIAIVLVAVTGLLIPAVSFYWHRSAADEQEADAYKTGTLVGMYVYWIAAPVWWFAWRGGFAPAPDGIAIYFLTIFSVGVIWLWKKYR